MVRAMPAPVTTAPATARRREVADRSTATSRSAARGATREARTAGARLATSVTTTPTARAIATVLVSRASGEAGVVSPMASIRASRPRASPMPAAMPPTEASRPTASASAVTEPSTWTRDAPSARRSADSRVRWATRIEKVL